MEKVTKRRVIKVSLAILIVVGILLGLLVVLTWDLGSKMSFGFLDGMPMMDRIERNPARSGTVTTYGLYSSEADFNEVCTEADAELPPLGFKVNLLGPFSDPPGPFLRHYQLFDATSEVWIVVTIRGGRAVRVSTRVTPQGSSRYPRHYRKNGWVSIEIMRRRPRLWPPRYLLYRLQRRFRRTANNPPPKNR